MKYRLVLDGIENLPADIYNKVFKEGSSEYITIHCQYDLYDIYRYGYRLGVTFENDEYVLTIKNKHKR